MSDVIGPLYNYANHIIDPVKLKVSGKGNMKYLWKDLGASIIGGCCGLGPDYIKAIA